MRIEDKIREIDSYLSELEEFVPSDFNHYIEDHKTKAACERYFEKIMEAIVDLAFSIIKKEGFKLPDEEKGSFDVLRENKIISTELAEKMKDAKGMRNIIAHEYGDVDDKIVFHSITDELKRDVEEFLDVVKKLD